MFSGILALVLFLGWAYSNDTSLLIASGLFCIASNISNLYYKK